MKSLKEQVFGNYWLSTGTPTFLIDLIKKQKELPENLEHLTVSDLTGHSGSLKTLPLHALLFQTGYLTVKQVEYDGFERYFSRPRQNSQRRNNFNDKPS